MKIVLLAFGSRGDMQPFLALAVALRDQGHSVTLAAPADFEALIGSYGVPYVQIPLNNLEVYQRDGAQQFARRVTPLSVVRLLREVIPEMKRSLRAAADLVAAAAQDADVLVSHGFMLPTAHAIHQHLGVPLVLGIAAPVVLSREHPSPAFPPFRFGRRVLYPVTHHVLARGIFSMMIGPMNQYRKSVGLPAVSGGRVARLLLNAAYPVLMHFSRHLTPASSDWPANAHVVGQWPLPTPDNWAPPDALASFLAAGEPPVYFGFGSMPIGDPAATGKMIGEALRLANLRGVIQAGWGGLGHDDEHLITIGDAPHDWLFPRMAAIVHHGGSGTTHSALRAGKPGMIVPFMADQPYWGRHLAERGVIVPPVRLKKLTPESLASALRTLTQDTALRQRAAEFGEKLRAEDGLGTACEFIERYVAETKTAVPV